MISIMPQDVYAVKRAALGPLLYPLKLFLRRGLTHILAFEAYHFFALAANDWRVATRVQVIFLDSDGRLLRIDDAQVENRADNLA
jgi:hypothetical protein